LAKPHHRRLSSAAVGIMLVGEKMLNHSKRSAYRFKELRGKMDLSRIGKRVRSINRLILLQDTILPYEQLMVAFLAIRSWCINRRLNCLRVPAKNNSTSCLSFGPSTALHPPTRISKCAG
jgi:hypothetical protein